MRPQDTSRRMHDLYEVMLMNRSAAERVEMAASMHAAAKEMALASLRSEQPDADERQLKGLLFLRFYGEEFEPDRRRRIYQRLTGAD